MKTFKLFALVFIVTLASSTIMAQGIHVGVTTAANATFVLDEGLSNDPRYNAEYTYNFAPIGFNFGVDISRKFGISLESILSKQGQVYQLLDAAEQVKGERKIELSYVNVPLLFRFMSGGNAATRANFNIGPQLSFLTDGIESVSAGAGTYTIPNGVTPESIQGDFPTAQVNTDGTYTIPEGSPSVKDILTKEADDFKNTEFQIAASFGVDIDLSKHLFLTTQIRANYSLTDMRNEDVIEAIKNGEGGDLFAQRANLLVGIQVGVHYSFGITRSFKYKQ
jgi:hypothetical protein